MLRESNEDTFEIHSDRSKLVLPELHGMGWCDSQTSRVGGPRIDGINCFEIGYLQRGTVEWLTEDGLHEARPGSVIIDWPGDWQGGMNAIIHPCERYWVRFDTSTLANTPGFSQVAHAMLDKDLNRLHRRFFDVPPIVGYFFEQLLEQQRRPGKFCEALSRAAFHQILFAVIEHHDRDSQSNLSAPVKKAVHYIENNFANDFPVEHLAARANLSCGYFHDLFQRETGVTPAQHQLNLRLRAGKQLLFRTDDSITNIALDVGFSSSQYFATVFKRFVGMTPREYRMLRIDNCDSLSVVQA